MPGFREIAELSAILRADARDGIRARVVADLRVVIRKDHDIDEHEEGNGRGTLLACVYVEQWWGVVKWDEVEDPGLFKLSGLEDGWPLNCPGCQSPTPKRRWLARDGKAGTPPVICDNRWHGED